MRLSVRGVAGVSLAYFLAKKGAKGILLLEQEKKPGFHASGRNAGMIRQVVPLESAGRLTPKGAAFLRTLPSSWKVTFRPCGSFLLVRRREKEALRRAGAFAERQGVFVEWLSAREAARRVPLLEGADFEEALFCPSDGVIDIHALLSAYLHQAKQRGLELWMGSKVKAIRPNGKSGFLVETSRKKAKTEILINASGAWIGSIARMAGAGFIPFRSYRRHMLQSRPLRWVDPRWPFVWDTTHGVYFRPEEGGLVFSPCDQDLFPAGRYPADRALALKRLRRRLAHFPRFPKVSIKRTWAGLRTFSPDDHFCIGWDSLQKHFFWIGGLDGHGMTTAGAVGDFASDLLLGRRADPLLVENFSPGRLQFTQTEKKFKED
ncbi:MAG: FAD-dependent oxidoreductase [Candidatus Omnitrophota bacterium]